MQSALNEVTNDWIQKGLLKSAHETVSVTFSVLPHSYVCYNFSVNEKYFSSYVQWTENITALIDACAKTLGKLLIYFSTNEQLLYKIISFLFPFRDNTMKVVFKFYCIFSFNSFE